MYVILPTDKNPQLLAVFIQYNHVSWRLSVQPSIIWNPYANHLGPMSDDTTVICILYGQSPGGANIYCKSCPGLDHYCWGWQLATGRFLSQMIKKSVLPCFGPRVMSISRVEAGQGQLFAGRGSLLFRWAGRVSLIWILLLMMK